MRHCRAAADAQLLLADAQVLQGLPGGDAHLRLHQVHVGDFLGDRVLDLDARVHLDEHVLPGAFAHGSTRNSTVPAFW